MLSMANSNSIRRNRSRQTAKFYDRQAHRASKGVHRFINNGDHYLMNTSDGRVRVDFDHELSTDHGSIMPSIDNRFFLVASARLVRSDSFEVVWEAKIAQATYYHQSDETATWLWKQMRTMIEQEKV